MDADEKQQPMNRQDAENKDRRWWLKMLAASAGLVAVLAGAYFLAPTAQLHYHAWRFRAGKDPEGEHLWRAAWTLAEKRADRETIRRILGEPDSFARPRSADSMVYLWFREVTKTTSSEAGCEIVMESGRATEVLYYGHETDWLIESPQDRKGRADAQEP